MRYLFLTFALFILPFTHAFAAEPRDSVYIKQAQDWLSNLKTATSRFEQIDYQGNVIKGAFYISRPGRLRFEYDTPIKDYIVADGYLIHFFDGDSGQVNSGPIGSTLADFILRDGNQFDSDKVTIDKVTEKSGVVSIPLTQTDEPGLGQLILNFSKSPFALKSWRIIDAQGLTTDIILTNIDRESKISPALFKMDARSLNK
jgi:outer membrane lipoprotein-sorting protein